MTERQQRAEALDRYWDAVQDGAAPGTPQPLDADDAALIAALSSQGTAPGLDRARADALGRLAAYLDAQQDAIPPRWAPDASPNDRGWRLPDSRRRVAIRPSEPAAPAVPGTPPRSSSIPARFATAVLLLALVAGGLGLARSGLLRRDAPELENIAPLAEDALTVDASLLHVVLPGWTPRAATPVPPSSDDTAGDTPRIDLFRLALDPGAMYEDPAVDIGTVVTGVEQGAAAVSVDGPATLAHRGEMQAAEIPAGTTVTLVAGDVLLTDKGTRRTMRPAAEDPVTILELSAQPWGGNRGRYTTVLTGVTPDTLPPGPIQVGVERVTLPFDAVLPLPAGATVLARVEDGMVTQSHGKPASADLGSERLFTYRSPGYLVAASEVTGPSEVRAAEGPATLLVLTFSPAATSLP
jgi:hypothetical protein